MIAGYGKIRRYLKNIYDNSELSELSGENLLDILQNGELLKNKITVFIVLATDYAAVGSESKLLREAINSSTENVNFILIAETEALLATKKPTNKNIVVVIEKSKKADVLRKIIERYITVTELEQNIEDVNSFKQEYIFQEDVEQDSVKDITSVNILEQDMVEEYEESQQMEIEKEEELDSSVEFSKKEEVQDSMYVQEQLKTQQETNVELFCFPLAELPEYKPLTLNKPEDIISYLIRRWG